MNSIARSGSASSQTDESPSRVRTLLSMPVGWWVGCVAVAALVVYALSIAF